jgi:DNA-directed RNA polymerase specialized sigma24 family protein
MGVVSYDINASNRRLETTFPLHTEEGVRLFLEKLMNLEQLKYYAADFDVVIWLADFYEALLTSNLSDTEKKVIYFLYFEGYRQKELVELLGIKKNTVNTLLKRASVKLANHYEEIRKLEGANDDNS